MYCSRLFLASMIVLIVLYGCIYFWIMFDIKRQPKVIEHIGHVPVSIVRKEEDFHGPQNPRVLFAKELESYLQSAKTDKAHWDNLNIMNMTLPRTLPRIKSPCWWSYHSEENKCPRFTLIQRVLKLPDTQKKEPVLRCLPHFYLIGQAKSGTTDLFSKITEHPEIVRPISKEPFWLMPIRFQKECSSLDAYLDQYKTVASRIQNQYTETNRSSLITGDGSTTTMSGNTWWSLLPGNEGCDEPCITNADIIHHLNPAARIIVSLRNPINRCYAYYIMKASILKYKVSQDHFHSLVENEIAEFNRCWKSSTLPSCVFNTSQENYLTTAISLRSSIYIVHLLDWLRVFPREQIHVVHFEHYTQNVGDTLSDIYKFLGVENLPKKRLQSIAEQSIKNKRKSSVKQLGDMWPKTKRLLDNFFLLFNEKLSVILNDRKFTWSGDIH